MLFLKHILSLLREFTHFALQHKVWWILPLLLVFLGIGALVVVTETSAPFIYTLF